MRITWDEPKRIKNIENHGMNFADLDAEFFLEAMIQSAKQGRLMAIGYFRDSIVSVVFIRLGSEAVSVISMRPASRKERRLHEQFRKTHPSSDR